MPLLRVGHALERMPSNRGWVSAPR